MFSKLAELLEADAESEESAHFGRELLQPADRGLGVEPTYAMVTIMSGEFCNRKKH